MYRLHIAWKRPWLCISCQDARYFPVYSCVESFLLKNFLSKNFSFASVISVTAETNDYIFGLKVELPNLSSIGISIWTILCFPVHCKMFRSILHLYPLDVIATPPPQLGQLKNTSRHCQMSLGEVGRVGKRSTGWEPLK